MLGMRSPGSGSIVVPQRVLEQRPRRVVGHVPVARELVREGAHVARALDVVLAAERVHADAVAADVARRHGEVRHPHDHRRSLAVLGDAEPVVDRRIAGAGSIGRHRKRRLVRRRPSTPLDAGIEPRAPHVRGGHARVLLGRLGAVLGAEMNSRQRVELVGIAPLGDELLVDQTLGDHDVCEGVHERDVRAREQRKMKGGLDVRRAHEIDPAGVGDDELRALAEPALHPRCEHRMRVGGVRADEQDHVGMLDGPEVLGAGRCPERLLETEAGR